MATINKEQYSEHVITLNGTIRINYRYWNNRFGGIDEYSHDHFEFNSLLISETGYLSHFVNSAVVANYGGHADYAELFCKEKTKDKVNIAQVDLFECCF
ncbi:MAG: hypothetical protein HOO93_05485 [Methyloglobulus sp.]|uniref:hypothetical protein n=1 Tax=Methyloglobulus sp. TaxID=2518622 RepID=UPI0017B03D7B|nr:hypothetical protein [Methyloglobulus sp.]